MKKLFVLFIFVSCIQTDLEDPFAPTFMIDNEIAEIEFRVSGSYELLAIYTDDTGESADVTVTWTSSNTDILSFEGSVATAHMEGQTFVTATANGLSDTRVIDILTSRELIRLSGFLPKMIEGNSLSLGYSYLNPNGQVVSDVPVSWQSSDTQVATIDNSGNLSALSVGETHILLSFGNVQDEMTLEVVKEGTVLTPEISITSFTMFLDESEEFLFEAVLFDEFGRLDDSTPIEWSSSNTQIVTVNDEGLVTGITPGTALIFTSALGVTDSINVEVEASGATTRTGTLMGNGYDIEGNFSLSRNENDDIILTIENYTPDGPGPYFYFSNQNKSVANGLNLGEAKTGGNYEINVTEIDDSIELSTFNYVVVWCEPFGVTLGYGSFEN